MAIPQQPGEAVRLSEKLSDSQIFILMNAQSTHKGEESRIFRRAELHKVHVSVPLDLQPDAIDALVHELENWRFLGPAGSGKLVCTKDGDCVKHNFNDMLDEMDLRGVAEPFAVDKVRRVTRIRRALKKMAAGGSWDEIGREFAR